MAASINYTFKPISLVADIAFAPSFNFLFDNIFEPYFLHSGEIILPFDYFGFGDLEYDFNLGFSQKPKVTNDSLEIYLDGSISVLGEKNEWDQKPIRFIDDEGLGFQIAVSDYVVNELIATIVRSNFTNILPLDTLFDGIDFHITTDMLEPVVPQLT